MKTYTIKKGSNYCREWWRKGLLWKPRGMVAKVKFNSSILYESKFDGWQKVVGFSLGKHHDNSFRFVWRVVNGFFQIGAYQYVGGVRDEARVVYSVSKHVFLANYEFVYLEIEVDEVNGLVFYRFGNIERSVVLPLPKNHPFPKIGYKLMPYYEQPKELDPTAPHDMTFEMQVKYF